MLVSEYYPLGSLFGTMWRLQQKMAECNELPPSTEVRSAGCISPPCPGCHFVSHNVDACGYQ